MAETLEVTGRDGTQYVFEKDAAWRQIDPYLRTLHDPCSALCDALLAARHEWVPCRIVGGDAEANTVTIEVPTARGVTMNATLQVAGLPAPPPKEA